MEDAEPKGLSLSLDELITKNRERPSRDSDRPGPHRRADGMRHERHERRDAPRRFDGGEGRRQTFHERRGGPGGPRYDAHPQQQHRQQQQQQQQPQFNGGYRRPPPPPPRPPPDTARHRQAQRCFLEEETGTVVFKYKTSELVRITPAGDITLTSDGYHNTATLASLNDALNPIGIRVSAPEGGVEGGQWSISDGKSLVRFQDGVVLPGKGQAERGRDMLAAFSGPNRSLAAAAAAASNAAASQAGILPPTGFVSPGRAGGSQRQGPSVFERLGGAGRGAVGGGRGQEMGDRERRLQRQGRYNPY